MLDIPSIFPFSITTFNREEKMLLFFLSGFFFSAIANDATIESVPERRSCDWMASGGPELNEAMKRLLEKHRSFKPQQLSVDSITATFEDAHLCTTMNEQHKICSRPYKDSHVVVLVYEGCGGVRSFRGAVEEQLRRMNVLDSIEVTSPDTTEE